MTKIDPAASHAAAPPSHIMSRSLIVVTFLIAVGAVLYTLNTQSFSTKVTALLCGNLGLLMVWHARYSRQNESAVFHLLAFAGGGMSLALGFGVAVIWAVRPVYEGCVQAGGCLSVSPLTLFGVRAPYSDYLHFFAWLLVLPLGAMLKSLIVTFRPVPFVKSLGIFLASYYLVYWSLSHGQPWVQAAMYAIARHWGLYAVLAIVGGVVLGAVYAVWLRRRSHAGSGYRLGSALATEYPVRYPEKGLWARVWLGDIAFRSAFWEFYVFLPAVVIIVVGSLWLMIASVASDPALQQFIVQTGPFLPALAAAVPFWLVGLIAMHRSRRNVSHLAWVVAAYIWVVLQFLAVVRSGL